MLKIEVKGLVPVANNIEGWLDQHGRFRNVEFKNIDPKEWYSSKGNLFIQFGKEAFITPAALIWLQQRNKGAKICKFVEEVDDKKKPTGKFTLLEVYADGKLTIKLDKESTPSLVG